MANTEPVNLSAEQRTHFEERIITSGRSIRRTVKYGAQGSNGLMVYEDASVEHDFGMYAFGVRSVGRAMYSALEGNYRKLQAHEQSASFLAGFAVAKKIVARQFRSARGDDVWGEDPIRDQLLPREKEERYIGAENGDQP